MQLDYDTTGRLEGEYQINKILISQRSILYIFFYYYICFQFTLITAPINNYNHTPNV